MRPKTAVRALLIALALGGYVVAPAREPSGHVDLDYSWAAAADGASSPSRPLTVTLKPAVAMTAVAVTFDAPQGVVIWAGDGSAAPHEGAPLRLGDLAAGTTRVFTFEVRADAGIGGVAVFRVSGILADGRSVAEGMGVPVGTPGPPPTIRNGAAEYPAASPQPKRR